MSKGNILLIYPSYSYPRKSPPLGLAYIASSLERAGYAAVIRDCNVTQTEDDVLIELLMGRGWIFVGMSFMTSQFCEAARLAKLMKRAIPDVPLIFGGPHASAIPERTMKEIPEIDIIVNGEGEETIKVLAGRITRGGPLQDVAGICYRDNESIVRTAKRNLIGNLDYIPFPAWRYLEVDKYTAFSLKKQSKVPAFVLLSSRGCPNYCIFCDSHTVFDRTFRARSAGNIYREIMHLHDTYGMTQFDFVDDLVTMLRDRMLELCALLKKSGVRFTWMANARVNMVDREMLQAMRDAGCIRLGFGVESGDPKVRERIRKNITDRQIRDAHAMTHELGMSTGSFTMVGNPGETLDSVNMTVSLLKDIGDDVIVSIACPFPGTELYRMAKASDYLNSEDWSRYVTSPTYVSDYHPVMRTEFMDEQQIMNSFYYVHSQFALRKLRRRYGVAFYLNPRFYRDWIVRRQGAFRTMTMAAKMIGEGVKYLWGGGNSR